MLDDLKERVETIRETRKKTGIRQIWSTPRAIELARTCAKYLSLFGTNVTIPEVLQIALEEFMAQYSIMTDEEIAEMMKEIDRRHMEEK